MNLKHGQTERLFHLGRSTGFSEATLQHLLACYQEPHRHYHTLTHLEEALSLRVNRLSVLPTSSQQLLDIALWFHDAIYVTDPYVPQRNEMQSAQLMRDMTSFLTLQQQNVCHRLILLTASHTHSETPLEHAMMCCDLGILASSSIRYQDYAHQIRQEFYHVDNLTFRTHRIKILSHFSTLASDRRLFLHSAWGDPDHFQAQTNLIAELRDLKTLT